MASNKNQHFVPRCYLKAFTKNGEGAVINLLNLDRKRCISEAPVKNQCSGDYFYGQDPQLEEAIQAVEGAYASVIAKVQSPSYVLKDEDRDLLRIFILMQHMRTEAASRRMIEMLGDMEFAIGSNAPKFKPSIKEAVQIAMRNFAHEIHIIDDLKVCLVRNRTPHSFVTSDDPVVMTNRWHLEDERARGKTPGVIASGAIFLLPLSPRVLCIAYDGDVYNVPHEKGWVNVHKERDIISLNDHQFLNARANIYFHEWSDGDNLIINYQISASRRLPCRYRTTYAVYDNINNNEYKVYRVIKKEDANDHEEALIHSETLMPIPASWPHLLRWRAKGFVYTNGTRVGYIRSAKINKNISSYYKSPSRL